MKTMTKTVYFNEYNVRMGDVCYLPLVSGLLRAYAEQFDRTFVGLTGTAEQLAAVWKAYGVSVVRRDLPGTRPPMYLLHHSASVFLIDPAGRLRVMAPFGTPVDDVVHDIRVLLEE
jgi:protein SCO1/2